MGELMKRTSFKRILLILLPCVLFAAMLTWFVIATINAASSTDKRELSALKTSIENSITMCYAIEGAYPVDVKYLCDHYGLLYDSEKYYVDLDRFASNIRPVVTVFERRAGSEKV